MKLFYWNHKSTLSFAVRYVCFIIILVLLIINTPGKAEDAIVDDETCLDCHDGYGKDMAKSSHVLSSTRKSGMIEIYCRSCHEGGGAHIEDPSRDNIQNPARLLTGETEKVCSQCHQPHTGLGVTGFDVHADQDIRCTECHSIHQPMMLSTTGSISDICRTCHPTIINDFQKRSNHPLIDGQVSCIDCHRFLNKGEPDFGHGASATCYTCHPGQSGPYLYEHEATSSFSPEGEGCTACHTPHASINERLLKQPDDRLCQQCHGIPPGHRNAHDGQFTGLACVDCHSEIHGSYDNYYLLDPMLSSKIGGGSEGCYCHYYR